MITMLENGHDVLIVGRFPGKYFHIEFYMYGEEWFKCMYIKLLKDLKIII